MKTNIAAFKKRRSLFQVFPWVWLVAAYCITFAVLIFYGRPYIDSDMSSEMVLANLLKEEGGLLSVNWWYSTELEFGALPLFYEIGLTFFPTNWYAARVLGQAIVMLLLVVSYLYAGHGLRLRNCGVWGAAALACPFGLWYFWYGTFGGMYLVYMIWQLLSFGAILHLLHATGKMRLLHWVLLVGTALVSGLNSIKGVMAFYLPMLMTSLVVLAAQCHQNPKQCPKRGLRLLLYSGVALLLTGVGYLINSGFLAKNHLFNSYNSQEWTGFSISGLLEQWANFLSLFGYPGDGFLNISAPLFSVIGILGAFSILIMLAIVLSTGRLVCRWKELQDFQLIAPVLLVWICLVQGLVFACTSGKQSVINASYWLTAMPFVFPVLQLEGETEHFALKITPRIAAVAFCCCFVATSIGATMQFFTSGNRINPHLETVCNWLTEQGYTQGYSTFWSGNVLTEWSNGQLDMWVTNNFNDMKPYKWLQKASHANPPEGPVFLLTTMDELGSMKLSQLYWWSNVVYEDSEDQDGTSPRYLVMTYKSYDDMMNAIHGAQSWEQADAQGTQEAQDTQPA